MEAFLTGSHAYGEPGPNSDIDLVVFVSQETANKLWKLRRQGCEGHSSLQLDNVNLITITDPDQYAAWEKGTAELLESDQPVSREKAVRLFKRLGVKAYGHREED